MNMTNKITEIMAASTCGNRNFLLKKWTTGLSKTANNKARTIGINI